MDKRKLSILKNDTQKFLTLSEPGQGGEVIARYDPSTDHSKQMAEMVKRWNKYPDLLAALEALELRCTQARIASNIGRPRLRDTDFLRGELERICTDARAAIAKAEQND